MVNCLRCKLVLKKDIEMKEIKAPNEEKGYYGKYQCPNCKTYQEMQDSEE